MKDAVLAAIAEVHKVGLGIEVLAIGWSYLMTQAEISRRIGKSRQMVHQYIRGVRGPGGFPPPARTGPSGQALWQWSEVAGWLAKNDLAPESLVRDAETVDTINCVLDYARKSKRDGALVREVRTAMAGKSA